MTTNENLAPHVVSRLMKEVRDYIKTPVEGVNVNMKDDCLHEIPFQISDLDGTPYEGGNFKGKLVFGAEFPSAPPKGFFTTPIFHPNVAKTGDICVNTLKRDWKADHTLSHILTIIRCLLVEPNAESALNQEAGKLILEDYEEFAKRARLMTSIHAGASIKKSAAEDAKKPSGNSAGSKGGVSKAKKKGLKRL